MGDNNNSSLREFFLRNKQVDFSLPHTMNDSWALGIVFCKILGLEPSLQYQLLDPVKCKEYFKELNWSALEVKFYKEVVEKLLDPARDKRMHITDALKLVQGYTSKGKSLS